MELTALVAAQDVMQPQREPRQLEHPATHVVVADDVGANLPIAEAPAPEDRASFGGLIHHALLLIANEICRPCRTISSLEMRTYATQARQLKPIQLESAATSKHS